MKNTLLYNSIILSDFGIMPGLMRNSYIAHTKCSTRLKSISLLSLPQLVISLKQLIFILNYVKQHKTSTVQIVLSNKQHFYLVSEYFKKNPLKSSTSLVFKTGLSYGQQSNTPGLVFTIILDSLNIFNKESILKSLMLNSNFLIQKVNSILEKQNKGTYKIFNELNDIKKILYLSILIEKVLSNNYEV